MRAMLLVCSYLAANYIEAMLFDKDLLSISNGLPDAIAVIGQLFRYKIPDDAFSAHVDHYEVKEASDALKLPDWLVWDVHEKEFYGVPKATDVGLLQLQVQAIEILVNGTFVSAARNIFTLAIVSENSTKSAQHVSRTTLCPGTERVLMFRLLLKTNLERLNPRLQKDLLTSTAALLGIPVLVLRLYSTDYWKRLNREFIQGNIVQRDGMDLQEGKALLAWWVGCGDHIGQYETAVIKNYVKLVLENANELGYEILSWGAEAIWFNSRKDKRHSAFNSNSKFIGSRYISEIMEIESSGDPEEQIEFSSAFRTKFHCNVSQLCVFSLDSNEMHGPDGRDWGYYQTWLVDSATGQDVNRRQWYQYDSATATFTGFMLPDPKDSSDSMQLILKAEGMFENRVHKGEVNIDLVLMRPQALVVKSHYFETILATPLNTISQMEDFVENLAKVFTNGDRNHISMLTANNREVRWMVNSVAIGKCDNATLVKLLERAVDPNGRTKQSFQNDMQPFTIGNVTLVIMPGVCIPPADITPTAEKDQVLRIVIPVIAVLIVLLLAILIVYLIRRCKKSSEKKRAQKKKESIVLAHKPKAIVVVRDKCLEEEMQTMQVEEHTAATNHRQDASNMLLVLNPLYEQPRSSCSPANVC